MGGEGLKENGVLILRVEMTNVTLYILNIFKLITGLMSDYRVAPSTQTRPAMLMGLSGSLNSDLNLIVVHLKIYNYMSDCVVLLCRARVF